MLFVDLAMSRGPGAGWFAASARVIKQYERGLVLRFGRWVREGLRGTGPERRGTGVDRLRRVQHAEVTMQYGPGGHQPRTT